MEHRHYWIAGSVLGDKEGEEVELEEGDSDGMEEGDAVGAVDGYGTCDSEKIGVDGINTSVSPSRKLSLEQFSTISRKL